MTYSEFCTKIISKYMNLTATKKSENDKSHPLPLYFVVLGSEIRGDPGWRKSGSGIWDKHPRSSTLL
jgi:hypothetical protein